MKVSFKTQKTCRRILECTGMFLFFYSTALFEPTVIEVV